LERRGTWRELERAADALRELALDARLLTVCARRACGQALELLVQCLRFLPVLQRERRAAGETACGTGGRDTCLRICLGVACGACAGFVIEGQREALERRGTWRELERAADALCELALDARLFSVRARRARRQALELLVQCLRFLPVLQRERRAAVNGTRRDRRRSKGEGKHEL